MSNKKSVLITIDHELWFYHRNKDTNLSQLVNNVLRLHRDSELISSKEITELEEDLKTIDEDLKRLNQEKTEKHLLILKKKQEEETEHQEEMEKIDQMNTMLEAGGQFRDMI